MTPQRWQKMKELCQLTLEREPGERSAFLAASCRDDEPLRRDVESLIARATASEGIRSPAIWKELEAEAAAALAAEYGSERQIPITLVGYRLVRIIGEGGMGVVYKAEQDHPRRIVALKLIKTGLASRELLRRFEQESEALARLHHPGIAQIYQTGTAETGFGPQPYFAMEFIQGASFSEYASSHHLNPRERLELMAKVCDAVEHAHQRGIIHRDLKPANILVEESGQPKVLDFGVARVTDADVQATKQTDLGQLIGTLAYMSPEQVTGDPQRVDKRSDVYALGLILYELLAERLPYAISPHLQEAVHTIQEEDPKPLSSVNRVYRGDVETIVRKALEKDKARRYPSAAALAEDIGRYLADKPITARPASATYQLTKFARRHKTLVAATVLIFTVLVGGIVISTREAVKARHAEDRAEAINSFLQNDLLGQASAANQSGPSVKPDPDLKVRTALDRAAQKVGSKFAQQPEVEAAIRDTIGQTYMDLGVYPEARTQLERALELHSRAVGPENTKTLKTMSRLGRIAELQGKYPEAEALFKQAVKTQQHLLGLEHFDTLYSMNGLTNVYAAEGKYAQTEALDRQILEIRRRVLGPEDSFTLGSVNNLASDYEYEGKYAQAEALHSQILEIRHRILGQEHPDTLASMNNRANVYDEQGKYPQAEALYCRALEIYRRVLGPEHPNTLMSMSNLANVYGDEGKYAQAEALDSEILETRRRVLGPEHRDTLASIENLAIAYAEQAEYVHARVLLSKTLEAERRVLGPEHPQTLHTLSSFASMYQWEGKYAIAQIYAAQTLAGRRLALGSEHPDTIASAADLALALISQAKFAESEPLAREAIEYYRKNQSGDWERFRAESLLGASLAGEKKYAEAEPLLLGGYQGMLARKDRTDVADWYHLHRAREWILALYQSWGKPNKVAEWRKKDSM